MPRASSTWATLPRLAPPSRISWQPAKPARTRSVALSCCAASTSSGFVVRGQAAALAHPIAQLERVAAVGRANRQRDEHRHERPRCRQRRRLGHHLHAEAESPQQRAQLAARRVIRAQHQHLGSGGLLGGCFALAVPSHLRTPRLALRSAIDIGIAEVGLRLQLGVGQHHPAVDRLGVVRQRRQRHLHIAQREDERGLFSRRPCRRLGAFGGRLARRACGFVAGAVRRPLLAHRDQRFSRARPPSTSRRHAPSSWRRWAARGR